MSETRPPYAPSADPSSGERPPRTVVRDSRTWEIEMLLSGAVTFALVQVPGVVDRIYDRVDAQLGGGVETAAFMGYYYVKLILYTIIASFVMHLIVRGYWVALIGLREAFPGGIRWEEVDAGPIGKEVYTRRTPPLGDVIAGANRFASSIFSFAFSLCFLFLVSIIIALVAGLGGWAVSTLSGGAIPAEQVSWVLFIIVVAPTALVAVIDKKWAGRIEPGSRWGRLIRWMAAAYHRGLGMRYWGHTVFTLSTNISKRIIAPLALTAFTSVIVLFLVKDVLVRRERLTLGTTDYLPVVTGPRGVEPRHYESLRTDPPVTPVPVIQSDIVRGPYVRLFIPYDAEDDDAGIAGLCPELESVRDGPLTLTRRREPPPPDEHLDRTLACIGSLWRITLNGEPIQPPLQFYRQPGTGVRGTVAYLATESLPRGRNLLVLERVELEADEPAEEDRTLRYHIPFWL